MKIYGLSNNNRTRKVLVAAEYAGVQISVEEFFPRGITDEQAKDFKKKNPNSKVPVLETPEGCIYESNAILRYIARLSKDHKLYGASKFEQAQVDQWLDWTATLYEPAFYGFVGPHFGYFHYNKDTWPASRQKLIDTLKIVENALQGRTTLVGNQVTIADLNLVTSLWKVYRFFGGDDLNTQLPNVTKWVASVSNAPQFVKVHGRFHVSKSALSVYQGSLPHLEEAAKKPAEKKPVEAKPKQAAQPKKDKKKDDDDDDDEPKEKKVANNLDSLPPSSFNLFDFKTLFVNAPNKKEALQFFWDNLDDKGYSVWKMDYEKAEGEGNVTFLTANLMNGYLQRLETFRKYAFGVCGVYGDEPNLEIRGVWVWRGTEIPFELKDHPSAEWYHFKKLDVKNSEADKKIQEEYWTGMDEDESKVEGLVARVVKYYK